MRGNVEARGDRIPGSSAVIVPSGSQYRVRPLLLPLLRRLRPDPIDGYADQFHRVHRLIAADRGVIDPRNYILPLHHHAEDGVLAVPYAHGTGGNEKLAAARIRLAGVCHGELADRKSTRLNSRHLVLSY